MITEELFKLAAIGKLAGIALIVVGLILRWRTTVVVASASLLTGLLAGMPLFSEESPFRVIPGMTRAGRIGIVDLLGKAFADNRLMTLFILTLPAIGLAERYGLQERSAALILRIRVATAGRLLVVYQFFRILQGALGIRLNGHPSFVRPLICPMSLGAAESTGQLTPARRERIKAANAAAENYGNFYGQNLSPVQAGVLLVFGVMQGLGVKVGMWDLVRQTLPVVVASIILGLFQFYRLDRELAGPRDNQPHRDLIHKNQIGGNQ